MLFFFHIFSFILYTHLCGWGSDICVCVCVCVCVCQCVPACAQTSAVVFSAYAVTQICHSPSVFHTHGHTGHVPATHTHTHALQTHTHTHSDTHVRYKDTLTRTHTLYKHTLTCQYTRTRTRAHTHTYTNTPEGKHMRHTTHHTKPDTLRDNAQGGMHLDI